MFTKKVSGKYNVRQVIPGWFKKGDICCRKVWCKLIGEHVFPRVELKKKTYLIPVEVYEPFVVMIIPACMATSRRYSAVV